MTASINWATLSDIQLVIHAEKQIWLSSIVRADLRVLALNEVTAAYDEAVRRDKLHLYQRAHDQAFNYNLSDADRRRP